MTWKQFCDLGNVPKWYQDVHYQTLKIPHTSEGDSYIRMAESFIQKPRSLVLCGGPGRGKTHFSYALMRGLFDSSYCGLGSLRFFRSKEFDDRILQETNQFGSAREFLKTAKDYQFLFLDDFGVERATERSLRDYYDLLDGRLYNMKTTVISTNLNDKGISENFGDRLYSRLKEFIWIEFDGPDLRGGKKL